ncbi:MAG: hypothetical protein ACI9UJ_000266 [bacterium]|jgi:uncharacterized protein (TIGR01777 family)
MKTILVTGASGLIGLHLCKKLQDSGYDVRVLGRNKRGRIPYKQFVWDIYAGQIEDGALSDVHAIIHLAGANISEGRWTDNRRQEIVSSRVDSTKLLFEALKRSEGQISTFITSSAIGYYGAQTVDTIFKESDEPATDFIGQVCLNWELAADAFENDGIRTVKMRTGVVFTPTGGPLAKMVQPIKLGFGSGLGKGSQYMPWVHIDDLCSMYLQAIENDQMSGPYNAVAPEHITNKELMKGIGKVIRKKVWLPNVPSFLLKLIFGELAVIFLEGSRVSPDRIKKTGFSFKFPEVKTALTDLLA